MLFELLLTLVLLCCARVFWRRWRYDLHRMPSPSGLPLLGHTLDLASGLGRTQIWLWCRNSFCQLGYPPIIRFKVGGMDWLVVRDTAFIKDVMSSKTNSFPRYLDDGGYLLPMIGNDVTAKSIWHTEMPTPYVKAFRKAFTTALSSSNLSRLMPKLNDISEKMMGIVETKRRTGPVNFQDLCSKLTLDIIGRLAFDLNFGALDGSRSLHGYIGRVADICKAKNSDKLLKKIKEWCTWLEISKSHKHDIGLLNAEYDWVVREIKNRSDPEEDEESFWWLLRNLKDPETGKLNDFKSLRSEVAGIVFAGMETTGQQLAWILCLLASHPDVANTLLKELKEHGLHQLDGKEVTFQDLGELTYLTAIIREGMRIAYAAMGTLVRYVPRDMDILGYRVPKGTLMSAPGTRSSNSEEEWGDPHAFRPERWMTDEDMSEKFLLGFSVGPRDCIGQRLAMLEMRLGIVRVMQRYHLKVEGDWRELLNTAVESVVISAKDGIWLHATPREVE